MSTPILGVVMNPIAAIKPAKDTTLALLLEAQRRGYALRYFEIGDLDIAGGEAIGHGRSLTVADSASNWFELGEPSTAPLADCDVLLMRQDPPVDAGFVYATQVLDLAQAAGARVYNRPASLLSWNEKLAIAHYPALISPTLVSADMARLGAFVDDHTDTVIKPLDGMGGASIFRLRSDDANRGVILETLTAHGTRPAMLQRYLPAVTDGDKRVLVIHGKPVPYALARIPKAGETRANLAAGGRGVGRELTARDREIAETIAPDLVAAGLDFVGLDVIGDCLTEINVTSPTCLRELDAQFGLNLAGDFFDGIEP